MISLHWIALALGLCLIIAAQGIANRVDDRARFDDRNNFTASALPPPPAGDLFRDLVGGPRRAGVLP